MASIPSSSPSTSPLPTGISTPSKRKRDPPPTPPTSSPTTNMYINTNIPSGVAISSAENDVQGSPRTKVAYNFQGLRLEDGGAVSKLDLQPSNAPGLEPRDEGLKAENAVRKRMKILGGQEMTGDAGRDREMEIPETPDRKAFTIRIGLERTVDPVVAEKARGVVLRNEIDPVIFKGNALGQAIGARGGLARAYPSINRLSDSKSRATTAKTKRRSGTPPLFGSAEASLDTDNREAGVVDEERAALTWHDDEITGHNPDDPDDDGEGINGIGFKPTPAMAYARTEKRRQQMLDYRNREAREARAKRSERRRVSEVSKAESREEAETARRVRFLEAEVRSVLSTT